MKKNNMLRIASVLLVAVLLSTCAISGAFAKYTADADETESARVAKWGITVDAAAADGFKTEYAKDDVNAEMTNTVVGTLGTDETFDGFVAPGTKGTFGKITITDSNREVAVKVDAIAAVTLTGWDADGNLYFPIVFSVNGDEVEYKDQGGDGSINLADIEASIEAAIAEAILGVSGVTTKQYDVDTKIAADTHVEVSWEWAYEQMKTEGENTFADPDVDAKDTLLGESNVANTISVQYGAKVTQID